MYYHYHYNYHYHHNHDYNHHGPPPSFRVPLNYEADPMGFYHIINAYEDSGHLVLDAPFKVGKIKT